VRRVNAGRKASYEVCLDRALEPPIRPLLALLDLPVEDAPWRTLDLAQRRQRTLDAVKRLLLRESQAQPRLVVGHVKQAYLGM
jgi:hypothetical protein